MGKYKFIGIGAAGLALSLFAIWIDSAFTQGVAFYLMAWGIIGDVLRGVTWQKHTIINTKTVDYHNIVESKEPYENL